MSPPRSASGASPQGAPPAARQSRFRGGRWPGRGRVVVWGAFALALIVAPLVFRSSLALSMLTQMAYIVLICLSYNLLLGQGGMLSFGHAVYVGLGAYGTIHTLNLVSGGALPLPVSLLPLVGGLSGLFFAALLGYVTTKKAATPFAMITLGIGELVFAMSLMFPGFFGGEAGISGNRVVGKPVWGISYGPQIQVYYLAALYCFLGTAALFALTRTPLGRMLNAVRDNPERVEFVGYDTRIVRYIAFMIAGFFAGIGGGLMAINFETVTAETLSGLRSGGYLLFTFLGGAMFFFGPIIGGVLLVLALVLFSEVTKAWQVYLGLLFMVMVMYAPGGIASLVMMNLRVAGFGRFARLGAGYLALGGTLAVALAGSAAIVEMVYHIQLDAALGSTVRFLGTTLDTKSVNAWVGALLVTGVGAALFELARRAFRADWHEVQVQIEAEIRRREAGEPGGAGSMGGAGEKAGGHA